MEAIDYTTYPEGFEALAETFDFIDEKDRVAFLMELEFVLISEITE